MKVTELTCGDIIDSIASFELAERTRVSGGPVYVGRFIGIGQTPGLAATRETLAETAPGYMNQRCF